MKFNQDEKYEHYLVSVNVDDSIAILRHAVDELFGSGDLSGEIIAYTYRLADGTFIEDENIHRLSQHVIQMLNEYDPESPREDDPIYEVIVSVLRQITQDTSSWLDDSPTEAEYQDALLSTAEAIADIKFTSIPGIWVVSFAME